MKTKELAKKIRIDILRMVNLGKCSHVGACFSVVDILSVLYGTILKHQPLKPKDPQRDRFILSKGHAGAAMYATLAQSGYFPREKLWTHYQDGSDLCGHVTHKGNPGVEVSTGSLGHGLAIATGMAFGAKLDKLDHRVFALLSDGECDEGSTWEAILFASHHKLDNLVAIIDYNKLQSLTLVKETLNLEPLVDKWRSFGWEVREVDGHDHRILRETLKTLPFSKEKPSCLIAHTIKGRGVSFMEHSVLWHYRTPQGEEYDRALKELESA